MCKNKIYPEHLKVQIILFDTTADLQGMGQIKNVLILGFIAINKQKNSELESRDSRWDWVCVHGRVTYPLTPNDCSSPASPACRDSSVWDPEASILSL